MRKLLTVLVVVLSIFQVLPALAQGKFYIRDLFDLYNDIGSPDASSSNLRSYDQIKGSPYINEDFVEGTVVKDSVSYKGIPLRYNAFDNQIEFQPRSGVQLYIDKPYEYKQFIIGDKKYIYNNTTKQYYELLEEGKIGLLKEERIIIKEAEPAKGYQDPTPAEFISKPLVYYISTENKDLLEIRKEKDLFEAISTKTDALQSYINKNKLKVRREEDLKDIISFYNQL